MTKHVKLPYSMLIYDIETSPLRATIWRPGEQVVRHGQLVPGFDAYGIITISYMWYGDTVASCLDFRDPDMMAKFDAIATSADVTIGKNSDKFDVKHLNTQRMLQGLPPIPQWMNTAEDLEKQLRKFFAFPSQSLDYVSKLMGFGGKEKMEFSDWTDIQNYQHLMKFEPHFTGSELNQIARIEFLDSAPQIIKKGKEALKKMIFYNKKDVTDTLNVLVRVLPYIQLKKNAAAHLGELACVTCGHTRIVPLRIVTVGQMKYQEFTCPEHGGYAGRSTFTWDAMRNKTYGKIKA